MATIVNRDVVVRDTEGREVIAKCIGQSAIGHWIKVLHPSGYEIIVGAEDFVRVHALEPQRHT